MKVRCIKDYKDKELNEMVKVNKVWSVSEERAAYLKDLGLVEIIEETKVEKAIKKTKKAERAVKKTK